MANNLYSLLAFLFILNTLVSFAVAGRDVPSESKKQPESFIHFDGSVLIPGIGRVMVPKLHHKGFNPFTHNPVAGTGGGTGTSAPSSGGSGGGGAGRSYVPGGDDTLVPNPGVEIPNPGTTGSIPSPVRP